MANDECQMTKETQNQNVETPNKADGGRLEGAVVAAEGRARNCRPDSRTGTKIRISGFLRNSTFGIRI